MSTPFQLGVIGLGTMGANLARNAARNGVQVSVYNRTGSVTDDFMKKYGAEGAFRPAPTLQHFVHSLTAPRAVLLMVKAGEAVDAVIADLRPLLSSGDIIIDAGNSLYRDTERRAAGLAAAGIRFVGMGVSGGEKGALEGPSMMPGGDASAWKELHPLFEPMAADDGEGGKCVAWTGPGGAGHFVKMVHNGIEYGIMQLIAESYDLLKHAGGLSNAELAETYAAWNASGDMQSYLLEITAEIFTTKDPEGSGDLVDVIADRAGQKGTGKWTTEAAHHYGVAIPTINAAVDARIISGAADCREGWRGMPSVTDEARGSDDFVQDVREALALSTLIAYMQGFHLLTYATEAEQWNLDLSEIGRIWQGGCIILSAMLPGIRKMYGTGPDMEKALTEIMGRFAGEHQVAWRSAVAAGIGAGIPLPAMTASLGYFDAMRRETLPQNLIQAQRDFFGAHGFERTDKPGTFHGPWHPHSPHHA